MINNVKEEKRARTKNVKKIEEEKRKFLQVFIYTLLPLVSMLTLWDRTKAGGQVSINARPLHISRSPQKDNQGFANRVELWDSNPRS